MPTLLVVDVAATDRVRVSGIAARWQDATIIQAENGKAALQQIEAHMPDLVLTDLHMPEMNGLELVAAVKNDFPNIPIVLMTAQGSEEIAAEALRTGAASYVPKLRLADDLTATLTQVYNSIRTLSGNSRLMHYLSNGSLNFQLPNDRVLIKSCVQQIADMMRCVPLGDESEQLRVSIAIQEAIENAYLHGNLEVTTEAGDDVSLYDSVAQARCRVEPYVHRRINVRVNVDRGGIEVTVRDDGAGFDTSKVGTELDLSSGAGKRGRGFQLIRSTMDEVRFNDAGNEIHLARKAVCVIDDEDDGEIDNDL